MTSDKIEAGEEGGCGDVEGELVPLERFDYSNDKLGCLLLESLDQLYFLGISGNVTFDEQGDRVSNTVRISQYQPGRGRPRLDGTLTMANALVGYASFEGDGDNITGLSVSLVDDNATVTFPDSLKTRP
ncbi:hypothetical protein GBAR_LOCUS15626 [Geodia barretti]|uniref:Uncharacterized protein n=1 Tax=Geodia barretti TaxID=519541 RepID=A0AA35WUN4_GEOBA|nr:hypothetical protein GBAR_LOCUS15626 [Geodia barretti]